MNSKILIATFLAKGKTMQGQYCEFAILPLCTHEGNGLGHSESGIKKLYLNAKVKKGLAIRGSSVKNAENEIAA